MYLCRPIRLREALRIISREANRIKDTETIPIRDALHRVLAENVESTRDIPPFDRAAMDGYAVRSADTLGASNEEPISLKIVGESDVGAPYTKNISGGEAVYVHTGAMIPRGADAVVPIEYTKSYGEKVYIFRSVPSGQNVSKKDEDVKKGEIILRKGRLIEPYDIAMLKKIGISKIRVYRKPLVSIFSCGNELVESIEQLSEGKIVECSREIIMGLAKQYGCNINDLGIVPDAEEKIISTIKNATKSSDMIITIGGTSIGKHDLIPKIIQRHGKLLFHGISIQPGKPICAGKIDEKLILGIPGPPVAAYIAGITVMKKAIESMLNYSEEIVIPKIRAILARKIWSRPGIRTYVRVKIEKRDDEYYAEPIMISGSGVLSSLVKSNGIIEIPEELEGIEEGTTVEVKLIRSVFDARNNL